MLNSVDSKAHECNLPSDTTVVIDKRRLLVNGLPYEVRGVAYSPLISYAERSNPPPDIFHDRYRKRWRHDLERIAALGANTIRLYNWDPALHQDDVTFLDACASVGLRVLLPISNYFLNRPELVRRIVYRVANHPALLMWAVTNEAAGPLEAQSASALDVYRKVARLIAEVRGAEQTMEGWHPIAVPLTCDLATLATLKEAGVAHDVDAFNCYWEAERPFPGDFYDRLRALSSKPLLISEFGIDAFDNRADRLDESVQSAHLTTQWRLLISAEGSSGASVGGVAFEWMDEPWKAQTVDTLGAACSPARGGVFAGWGPNALPDQCANEAFFGLTELNPNGSLRLKPVYHALRKTWSSTARHCTPALVVQPEPQSAHAETSRAPIAAVATASASASVALLLLVSFVALILRRVLNNGRDEQRLREDEPALLRDEPPPLKPRPSGRHQQPQSELGEVDEDVTPAATRQLDGGVELASGKKRKQRRRGCKA